MLDFGFYNMDCMDGMREFPDNYFELAVVDPPYGINIGSASMGIGGALHHTETAPQNSGGGTEQSGARNHSETIRVGGVSASVPKFTRRSMTATHRTPLISKNWREWQNTGLYGVAIIFSTIFQRQSVF